MIKKIIATFFIILGTATYAQEGSSSPYSFYGLGETRFKGTVENRAMGGISVLADSIHMNIQNPALYSNLSLTTFTVGGTFNTTRLKSENDKEKAQRTTLDYLAVAFPMGKFSASFGLVPYSSVGYKIARNSTSDDPVGRTYNGQGDINKVYFAGAYKINDNWSAGIEFGYHFGEIETTALYRWDGVSLGTRETNTSAASGFGVTTGLAYKTKIDKKYDFMASATYGIGSNLSFSNQRVISTIQFYNNGSVNAVETEDVEVPDTEVKLPSRFSFGAGFGQARHWMVGAEFTMTQNSDLDNRFVDIGNSSFENAIKLGVGGYYIPKYNAFNGYFKRVVYRGGLKFEKTGLVINGESINDTGVTFGLGLPLGGTFSNINLGAEFGKRGKTDAGLIQENYANFSISLSLNDRWFVKRKYD